MTTIEVAKQVNCQSILKYIFKLNRSITRKPLKSSKTC